MPEVWDMHQDESARVPAEAQLAEGTFVRGTIICHHAFGLGVRIEDVDQYAHVNVPLVRDGPVRVPDDFPAIGQKISGVLLGYDGHGQPRLTLRLHDLPGYR